MPTMLAVEEEWDWDVIGRREGGDERKEPPRPGSGCTNAVQLRLKEIHSYLYNRQVSINGTRSWPSDAREHG